MAYRVFLNGHTLWGGRQVVWGLRRYVILPRYATVLYVMLQVYNHGLVRCRGDYCLHVTL